MVLVENETVNETLPPSKKQCTVSRTRQTREMDIPLSIGSAISGPTLLFSSRMVKNFRELSLVMKIYDF